jgi:carbon-monoxide dehydrogenase medium subunit
MKAPPLDYTRPDTLGAAISAMTQAGEGAKVLGGGQSLGPMLNLRVVRPDLLVDVSRLDELSGIEETADGLRIGAGITHSAIEDGAVPDATNGLMNFVASQIAYRAVRNRGTIGGSLAHADPAGDWAPVMMALGAAVAIKGAAGRREVTVAALIEDVMTTVLGPDEVLVDVLVPRISPGARWGHYKLTRKPGKFADAIAVVVSDRGRGHHRVAIARPSAMPRLLESAGLAIAAATGWSDALDREIREAVSADLAGEPNPNPDPIQRRYHMVTVARAARRALMS